MDKDLKQKWLEALRSGKYKQGTGFLRRGQGGSDKFCCLGVLCDIVRPEDWLPKTDFDGVVCYKTATNLGTMYMPPQSVGKLLGDKLFNGVNATQTLASKNDDGESFEEIAKWIEENL